MLALKQEYWDAPLHALGGLSTDQSHSQLGEQVFQSCTCSIALPAVCGVSLLLCQIDVIWCTTTSVIVDFPGELTK